ncbi:uncharacterized protein LOC144102241 [Amblyomma americanum]
MAPRRLNHCFAPGCKTGYVHVKGAPKPSLFSVPKDEALRRLWEKNLHRADKPLEDTSAVCELHFEPRYVIRDYVHIIGGKEVRIPRGKPLLSSDAVPTILPNLPAYLTKKAVKERPARKRKSESCASPAKRRPCSNSDTTVSYTSAATIAEQGAASSTEAGVEPDADAEFSCPLGQQEPMLLFDSLQVPSEQWTKHRFPGHDGVVYCTSVLTSRNEVCSEKVVMFFQSQTHSYYKVFVRGILLKESTLQTSGEAEDVLRATDSMSVCTGVMRLEDYEERYFTKNLKSHVVTLEQMYFSSNCLGQFAERGNYAVHFA